MTGVLIVPTSVSSALSWKCSRFVDRCLPIVLARAGTWHNLWSTEGGWSLSGTFDLSGTGNRFLFFQDRMTH